MSLLPRTVYVVGCDNCGATYCAQGPDEDSDFELTLPTPQLDPAWARRMTSEGWIATTRHLCPECVTARGNAFVERLELERTKSPSSTSPSPAPPSAKEPTRHDL
ncbi:hypothetical protein J7E93_06565 [Streptomyces sp. ISL-36]|uniref:hypothetical protein n=1 Tax=Streptomyces sp. ISL-36 TaxID=2819182 RepID=UPI001BEAF3C9|nr:hypothetical protein [Streptomyces sp. ISL-36]MBT2439788.1 hypothetical protein [Streptomyces sp. ISL-36]